MTTRHRPNLFKRLVEAWLWRLNRLLFTVSTEGSISIIDLKSNSDSSRVFVKSVKQAFDLISEAGGGFGELVKDQLKVVARTTVRRRWVSDNVRGYFTPFNAEERDNPTYFATRLVFAATSIRLYRDAIENHRWPDRERVWKQSIEEQLRFVKQFEDSEKWERYIRAADDGLP